MRGRSSVRLIHRKSRVSGCSTDPLGLHVEPVQLSRRQPLVLRHGCHHCSPVMRSPAIGCPPRPPIQPVLRDRPAVNVPAPQAVRPPHARRQATRIELDGADPDALSAWYRLAFIERGTHLQVFEHYAATGPGPADDIVNSERTAWILANLTVEPDRRSTVSDRLPKWAWFHTGNDTGPSAGLMFTLTYIDLLTPGALVGDLRVAGTGASARTASYSPCPTSRSRSPLQCWLEPDVIFTPRPSKLVENTTVIESEHTRIPADGYTIGEWLNVRGYEQAGREAAEPPRHHRVRRRPRLPPSPGIPVRTHQQRNHLRGREQVPHDPHRNRRNRTTYPRRGISRTWPAVQDVGCLEFAIDGQQFCRCRRRRSGDSDDGVSRLDRVTRRGHVARCQRAGTNRQHDDVPLPDDRYQRRVVQRLEAANVVLKARAIPYRVSPLRT